MIDPRFGFDSAFLARLERLSLPNRRPIPGTSAGPRRSPHHGASVEFADFRSYSSGDDFRRIDWNAYARLGRLVLRLYSAEEATTVTLFLDHSTSMSFGEPSKALAAARFAALFAYVALQNYDRVAVLGWGESVDRYVPPQGGRSVIPQIWMEIAQIMNLPQAPSVSTSTDFAALRDFGRFHRGRGLAIVLSDLLTDTDWQGGLHALVASGQEVSLAQILAPEEIDPSLRGDWKLRDLESGQEVEVTVSPRLLKRYREEFAAHTNEIREFCRHQSIPYVQLRSDAPVDATVLTSLQTAGLLG
jgi:uncharacterized protein (DUF58 family)